MSARLYTASLSIFCFLLLSSFSGVSLAQDSVPNRDPRFVDNTRGNIPIPTNPAELQSISLDLWLKFRRTRQNLYHYIREASEFRAYSFLCKRHDLNVNMTPINAVVSRNLQQIIIAHYEEPDYEVLESISKEEQAILMKDIASDLYSFEYGYQLSAQQSLIENADATTNNYCVQAEDTFYGKYIALLATARRQQN